MWDQIAAEISFFLALLDRPSLLERMPRFMHSRTV
jgi:hypothetical protein